MKTCDGCNKKRRDLSVGADGMGFCFCCRKATGIFWERPLITDAELAQATAEAAADEASNEAFWNGEL